MKRLDEIRARDSSPGIGRTLFAIANEAILDRRTLFAAVDAALELHRPVEIEPSDTICGECSYRLPNGRYFGKVEYWPCATVRAITEAVGE